MWGGCRKSNSPRKTTMKKAQDFIICRADAMLLDNAIRQIATVELALDIWQCVFDRRQQLYDKGELSKDEKTFIKVHDTITEAFDKYEYYGPRAYEYLIDRHIYNRPISDIAKDDGVTCAHVLSLLRHGWKGIRQNYIDNAPLLSSPACSPAAKAGEGPLRGPGGVVFREGLKNE